MSDSTNYGGGFGTALYDILLQKRKEARQAMLDEVDRQNVMSEIAAREDQAATNKLYRESQAANMKAAEGEKFIKHFHKGQEVSPETYGKAKGFDLQDMFSAPVPAMGPDFQGPMPEGQTPDATAPKFLGSPEEQEADEDLKRVEAYINSPAGQALSPEDRAAMYYNAVRSLKGTMPAGFFKGKDAAKGESAILLPDNTFMYMGQKVRSVPAGTPIVRGFAPPRPGSTSEGTWTIAQVPDPNDPTKTVAAWVNGKQKSIEPVTLPPALAPKPQEVQTPDTPVVPPPENQTPGAVPGLSAKDQNASNVNLPSTGPKDPRLTTTVPPAAPQVFSRTAPPKPATADKGITSQEVTAVRNAFEQTRKNLKTGASTGQSRQIMYSPLHVAQMSVISHIKEPWMRDDVIGAVQAAESVDYNSAKYPFGSIQNFIENEVDPSGQPLNEAQKADLYRVLSYVLGNF